MINRKRERGGGREWERQIGAHSIRCRAALKDSPRIFVANIIYTNVAAARFAVNVIDYAQQIQSPSSPIPAVPELLQLSSMLAKISRNYNKLQERERGRGRKLEKQERQIGNILHCCCCPLVAPHAGGAHLHMQHMPHGHVSAGSTHSKMLHINFM